MHGLATVMRKRYRVVVNEPFDALGAWVLPAGLAIDTTLNKTEAPGTQRTATLPNVSQPGALYRLTFTLTRSAGSCTAGIGLAANGTTRAASGTYVETIPAGGTGNLTFGFTTTVNTGATVDNLLVERV